MNIPEVKSVKDIDLSKYTKSISDIAKSSEKAANLNKFAKNFPQGLELPPKFQKLTKDLDQAAIIGKSMIKELGNK